MLGKNHLLLGAAASTTFLLAVGVSPLEQPSLFAGGLLAGSIGALLPDIDSGNTKIRTSVGLGSRQAVRNLRRRNQDVIEKSLNISRYVLARQLDILTSLLPHRGVTHWGLTWFAVALLARYVAFQKGWHPLLAWLFALGYASHLLADSLTRAGIPFVAPISRRKIRLLPRKLAFRTGSGQEQLAVGILLSLMVALLVLQPQVGPLLADGPLRLLLTDLLF